jgi:hypothetical protein
MNTRIPAKTTKDWVREYIEDDGKYQARYLDMADRDHLIGIWQREMRDKKNIDPLIDAFMPDNPDDISLGYEVAIRTFFECYETHNSYTQAGAEHEFVRTLKVHIWKSLEGELDAIFDEVHDDIATENEYAVVYRQGAEE